MQGRALHRLGQVMVPHTQQTSFFDCPLFLSAISSPSLHSILARLPNLFRTSIGCTVLDRNRLFALFPPPQRPDRFG